MVIYFATPGAEHASLHVKVELSKESEERLCLRKYAVELYNPVALLGTLLSFCMQGTDVAKVFYYVLV